MPQGERSVPLGGVPRGGPPLGDSLVTFSSGRKSPGCRAERLHWGPQGLPAPHKLPGRGAERPPRNKHTPGTATQAVGARTKPMRESGAASCRREMGAGSACRREGKAKIKKEPGRESGAASCRRLNKTDENFDLHKRAQPKASDLRESVQSRPAGGPFAKWVQAQPAANRARHHAVREMGAGSACRREGKAKIKKEPGRESGAASCRRELRPGSAPSNRISAIKCPLRERKTKTKSRAQNANCVQAQPGGGGEGN